MLNNSSIHRFGQMPAREHRCEQLLRSVHELQSRVRKNTAETQQIIAASLKLVSQSENLLRGSRSAGFFTGEYKPISEALTEKNPSQR